MGTVLADAASVGIDSTDGRGAPLALVGIQDNDDPCCWERSGQPWEVIGTLIGSGPFRIRKVFLATPNCILYRESCATRMRIQALSPAGMLACVVPVKLGSQTSYFRRPLHERGLPATLPTGLEAVLDQGQEHLLFLVQRLLLRRHLPPEQVELLEAGPRHACCPPVPRPSGAWVVG
ncbi:MAG TPA: hypothetical protein VES73_09295 [Lamprocystis sp. (in: g-proteobacteria)]|nr:hypothetical protein [Lamprocystis sp. (in: g-proteobacteria)]